MVGEVPAGWSDGLVAGSWVCLQLNVDRPHRAETFSFLLPQEIKILLELDHPSVLKMYEFYISACPTEHAQRRNERSGSFA